VIIKTDVLLKIMALSGVKVRLCVYYIASLTWNEMVYHVLHGNKPNFLDVLATSKTYIFYHTVASASFAKCEERVLALGISSKGLPENKIYN